jgi:hypothetical protein
VTVNNAFSLWAAPLAGGAPARVLWNAAAGREVERLAVTSDSTRAVFTADGVVAGRHQLYVGPVDGSVSAAPLPTTAGAPKVLEFVLTPDATRAVYTTGSLVASVLLDGSAPPVILSPSLAADSRVVGIPVVDDEWVLLRADPELRRRFDLFVAPIDGSLPARRVNIPLGAPGVESHAIAGDEILFVAPSTPEQGSGALFRAPLDGARPPRVLNPPGTVIATTSSPGSFRVHPDEHRVLFSAYSESGFLPSSRLFLGFLGQPIRGAERP